MQNVITIIVSNNASLKLNFAHFQRNMHHKDSSTQPPYCILTQQHSSNKDRLSLSVSVCLCVCQSVCLSLYTPDSHWSMGNCICISTILPYLTYLSIEQLTALNGTTASLQMTTLNNKLLRLRQFLYDSHQTWCSIGQYFK